MKPMMVILAESALLWQQKRTVLTQECIQRLLNTKKELNCATKQGILNRYTQVLNNYGYNKQFRKDILSLGVNGYNKILAAHKSGERPLYGTKGWNRTTRWMGKKRQQKGCLRYFKSCIYIPPTPNSELKKVLQAKEKEMRVGGREKFPIQIIETAVRTLERELVKVDSFGGNMCNDKHWIPNKNKENKISCRKNNIGYQIPCKICQRDGKAACYFGETGCNMHKRMKEHLIMFRSKNKETREASAFYKHIESEHGGVKQGECFETYFLAVNIVKVYTKVHNRNIEDGTFMINHAGEVINSKTEWNQPRIIRTTILQGEPQY